MRHRSKERQRLLFPIHWPKQRPLPKLDHDQIVALIRQEWRKPDSSIITDSEANHWTSSILHHLRFEPGPIWMPPKPRKRPERPTAERIRSFLSVETDWIKKRDA